MTSMDRHKEVIMDSIEKQLDTINERMKHLSGIKDEVNDRVRKSVEETEEVVNKTADDLERQVSEVIEDVEEGTKDFQALQDLVRQLEPIVAQLAEIIKRFAI